MRAIIAALAALGGGVILAACAVSVATGDSSEVGWLVVGPLSFLVIGLVGFLRQPENRVAWWLVGVGVAFGCDVALGDVFLPMAESHWGVTSSITAAIALLEHWFAVAGPVAGVGLFGLFPSGRPERVYERVVIWTVALAGFLLPLLEAVSKANIAPAGGPPDSVPPVLYRALYVPALAPLGGAAEAVYRTFPVWPLIGVALLALRYRRTDGAKRRQIRWLVLGLAATLSLWTPLALLWQLADPDNAAATVAGEVLVPLALATTVGSMLVALFYTGAFGIDEPARRTFVHRVLRVSITVVLALLAILVGVLTSLAAPAAVAVAVAVAAGAAGQTVRRRLEHAADRWVLGARLAGYANLSRFGESLTQAPGSAGLLRDLAGEVRRGLDLTWARVSLDAADGPLRVVTDGTPAGEPAATVPIEYRGSILGRIECGPRSDGPLLAEDRRLLAYFATQAAVGVHNLYLAAELSRRIEEVRDQAAELAASRDRVVAGQDAERRRIQRSCTTGSSRRSWRCRPGPGWCASSCCGAIRPRPTGWPTCSAIWPRRCRTSGRSPTRSIRRCCPTAACSRPSRLSPAGWRCRWRSAPTLGLRGVRFGEQIEVTAWYVLSEALSNVVKHAGASEVEVSLERLDGTLGLVIRDDGCGFDLDRPRGLGLTGLSDRLDTVGGSLTINSGAGLGTSVCVHIPVGRDTDSGPEQVAGRERADA